MSFTSESIALAVLLVLAGLAIFLAILYPVFKYKVLLFIPVTVVFAVLSGQVQMHVIADLFVIMAIVVGVVGFIALPVGLYVIPSHITNSDGYGQRVYYDFWTAVSGLYMMLVLAPLFLFFSAATELLK